MQYRTLGKTGYRVSTVSFGAWAAGGDFGPLSEDAALDAMREAVTQGINFFDTADVYGDGVSERLVGRLKREHQDIIVATKAGRRLSPHRAEGYDYANLSGFVERSRANLGIDQIDLLQLHCPPTEVYYDRRAFDALAQLQHEGKIAHAGVSIEKCEEGLKAIEFPEVTTLQLIYNMVRHRPAELLLPRALGQEVGIIARVPLASGLLSGKMSAERTFAPSDHRNYNRNGEAFDPGETFSGLELRAGAAVADRLKQLCPRGVTLAQLALRWILMNPAVSCAIPGGKTPDQVRDNARAAELAALNDDQLATVDQVYWAEVAPRVHHRW